MQELEEKLYLLVLGIYGDGLLSQGSSAEECLSILIETLIQFKEIYPHWSDSYSTAYDLFVIEKDETINILDKYQREVEAKLF